ncbi:PDR/VanB family oxidoreductase [Phytopseudomonas dryadis]|uniref:Oxidoreductase n=1 Tax=Phytopseudomonas dryadis TaxID=2487520 RepID=A0A4Q9QV60_9GAMM|nr:PDR/VanB family oxidoreductase [Pseudomonas dryadis]TBU87346.1 oxidoreductase [Pseudomonas dryadis]
MAPSETVAPTFRLTAMRYGARDIVLYEFQPLDGLPLAPVQAGAHLDIVLPNGQIRSYSLLTPLCDAERYVVAVKRDANGQGGSRWLHDQARVGQTFGLQPPRNHFALTDGDTPVLLLAGGIGITPLFSMLAQLRSAGRPAHLHYWSRDPEQTLFLEALQRSDDVTLHFSSTAGRRSLADILAAVDPKTEIYCCGPLRMLADLETLSAAHGLEHVRVERFQGASPPATANEAFTVVLARSGSEVQVCKGETILGALLEAGVEVMYSCEQGICGACEVRVVAGEPLHADSVYSAEEHEQRGSMMICCSSSNSARLVLDI